MCWQFLNSKEGLSNGQVSDQGIGMVGKVWALLGLPAFGYKHLSAAHLGKAGQASCPHPLPSTPIQRMSSTRTPVMSAHTPHVLTYTAHAGT